MDQTNSRYFRNKVLQIASELKYQLPLMEADFVERGCGCCGAKARFPGPCIDCAELELIRLIGEEDARMWMEACRAQQRTWKSIEEKALTMSSIRSKY